MTQREVHELAKEMDNTACSESVKKSNYRSITNFVLENRTMIEKREVEKEGREGKMKKRLIHHKSFGNYFRMKLKYYFFAF